MIVNLMGDYKVRSFAGLYLVQNYAIHKYHAKESILEGIKNIFQVDDSYLYGEYYDYAIDNFGMSVPELVNLIEPIVLNEFPDYYSRLLDDKFASSELPIVIFDFNSHLAGRDIINVNIGVDVGDYWILFSDNRALCDALDVLMFKVGAKHIV